MERPAKRKRRASSHSGEIDPLMEAFKTDGDIDVILEGDKIRVHSALLGLTSPVFAALLRTEMRERHERSIHLPGKTKEEFELFMTFLQPLERAQVDMTNVDQMLPWFDEYQILALKKECEELLLSEPVTSCRLLQAHKFQLHKLYKKCLKSLSCSQFQSDLQELTSQPEVVRALLPHILCKRNEFSPVLSLVGWILDKDIDIKRTAPLLELCFQNFEPTALHSMHRKAQLNMALSITRKVIDKGIDCESALPLLRLCFRRHVSSSYSSDSEEEQEEEELDSTTVLSLVEKVLDIDIDFQSTFPVLKLCLSNVEHVGEGLCADLLQLLTSPPSVIDAMVMLLGRLFADSAAKKPSDAAKRSSDAAAQQQAEDERRERETLQRRAMACRLYVALTSGAVHVRQNSVLAAMGEFAAYLPSCLRL